MAHDTNNSQTAWNRDCNRVQRRSNEQKISDGEDGQLLHYKKTRYKKTRYKKTRYGDICASPDDGPNWRRGEGHDKKKTWRGLMLGKIALYLSFTLLGFSICYGIHNAGLFKADLFNDRAVNEAEHSIEHAVEKTEPSLDLTRCT